MKVKDIVVIIVGIAFVLAVVIWHQNYTNEESSIDESQLYTSDDVVNSNAGSDATTSANPIATDAALDSVGSDGEDPSTSVENKGFPVTTLSSASSLSSKTWRSMANDNNYTDFVRDANGVVTSTAYVKCIVCVNGQCGICGGTGVDLSMTTCVMCRGSGKCVYCGGNGATITSSKYQFIDEYYSNGLFALHVTSSPQGVQVYSGGMGYVYYSTDGRGMESNGTYYYFGNYKISKDYTRLWSGDSEFVLIDKASYDKVSTEIGKINQNASAMNNVSSNSVGGNQNIGNIQNNSRSTVNSRQRCHICSGTGSCSNPRSPYNTKTYCHGSGRCPLCGGDGWVVNPYTSKSQRCSSCRGNGRCQTCLGTGQCKRCGGSGYL